MCTGGYRCVLSDMFRNIFYCVLNDPAADNNAESVGSGNKTG